MRWLLTGDTFDAEQALRLGLVQELTDSGRQLDQAIAIAKRIGQQAPLGIRETMASAHRALPHGEQRAGARLREDVVTLIDSQDAKEGMLSFLERRPAVFTGR
jgi:enoyl-CoA hydratase